MLICFIALASAPKFDWVEIPDGTYSVGHKDSIQNPKRSVKLSKYAIAKFETTNDQFLEFVKASGYVTVAEKLHNSMVFEPGLAEFRWIQDKSATWKNPNGKSRDNLEGKGTHPVTGICYQDALAYCKWAGVRLPSLDEWEVASRCGSQSDTFFDQNTESIRDYANIWLGKDHRKPDVTDGFLTTSPVGSFLPNPWGLYDVYGNVFEFCTGYLPGEKNTKKVHGRGGSWWCSQKSCCFFNSRDVGQVMPKASFSNLGFRVAKSRG